MRVYVAEGSIYCSKECVLVEHETAARPWALPGRQRNAVLDQLLGRATCDTCGFNLEDLANERDGAAVREANRQDALYCPGAQAVRRAMKTFYFIRINGVNGRSFSTKRAAVAYARRCARISEDDRISLWFRDIVGQNIPVNWRPAKRSKFDKVIAQSSAVEDYALWIQAEARHKQVKLAGYSAYIVDSQFNEGRSGSVRVFIGKGKHEDLSRLPAREVQP